MYVKLLGPEEGQESEHKIDGATAVFLYDQIRGRNIAPLMIDGNWFYVRAPQVHLITTGPEMTGILTLTVTKADGPQ